MDATPDGADAHRRSGFVHGVAEQLDALRRKPEAWTDYLTDAEQTSVRDGVA